MKAGAGVEAGKKDGRMSICFNAFFLQDHLGGIGNYTFHLIRNIRTLRPGWDLILLVHKGSAPQFRSLEGVRLIEIGLRGRTARLIYFHLLFPFRAARFDLLHSVGNMGMLLCPVPQAISIHDLYERVSPERFSRTKRLLMRFLISWSGRRAGRVIAGTENTGRDIARFYPHLAAKTRVIHYGNKFQVSEGAEDGPRRDFIFVGTIEPGKNLSHILRAFALTAPDHNERLQVVGAAGWGQSGIPALLEKLGIRDRVEFLGYVTEGKLREIYSEALALVMASSYEGFGFPVIEAMACGCPVISARNSGLVEAGGDAALYFETGNVEAMAGLMEKVRLDAGLRRERMRLGFLQAAKFTWKSAAEKTIAAYEEIRGE